MKIIKIIFFSFLALSLIVCTGIFIFSETFDTDQYLAQITKKASLALGRPVAIGHLGLGFSSRGITLDAGPLTIADDAAFTTQPFIKVDRVRISLDLRPLILRHEIHITDILFQSPQIHFIRSREGNINGPIQPPGLTNSTPGVGVVKINMSNATTGALGKEKASAFLATKQSFDTIKSIKIQDGSISFIDQSQGMPLDIWLSNINASLSKTLRLSFNASPLVFKGTSPGMPDSPIFKNIAGVVQLNTAHLEGNIAITDGVIKNFNIIKTVLSHTPGVFGEMDGVIDKLGAGANDTIIDKVQAQFSLHDKTVFIDDSLIKTNIFEFTAKGSVDNGLNMDMQTMLHLNADVSAALVNELEGLKFLCDDSKRITIDAGFKGVFPHLKYKLNKDFRKKSKNALFRQLFRS